MVRSSASIDIPVTSVYTDEVDDITMENISAGDIMAVLKKRVRILLLRH